MKIQEISAVSYRVDSFCIVAFKVLAASLVMVLASKLYLPLLPVPATMQTLAVLGLGVFLGGPVAASGVALYLLEGAVGMPVFASSATIGVAHLLGPTGGYLISFPLMAFVAGHFYKAEWNFTTKFGFFVMLNLGIYCFGLLWLQGYMPAASVSALLKVGCLPFVLGDLAKIVLLMGVLGLTEKVKGRRDLSF